MLLSEITSTWTEKNDLLAEGRLSSLGLKHGMSTRRLGDMKDPAKRRAAASLLGLAEPLVLHQVHGTKIHLASRGKGGLEGDGWIVDVPNVCVAVYAADCVPLYLWSDDGRLAGVFHAGWRGTSSGMAQSAVAAFARLGMPSLRLFAAAGPHIGACCYRVGPELEKNFPSSSFVRRGDELFLDLAAEMRRQLLEAGMMADRIAVAAPCTASCPDDYFSFRRDKQDARMLALLSIDRWPS